MRTRFLNVDYLSASQSSTEILSFLSLPPPHLPPRISKFNVDLHFEPFLNLPLQTERLPIDAALSKFLSESIPQFIDVDISDFEDTPFPSGNAGSSFSEEDAMVCSEEREAGIQRTFGSEILEKDNVTCAADKDNQRFNVTLFETPELDTFLDNVLFSEKEFETFSGVPEIDNNKDETGLMLQFSSKIQESIYSVEDVISVGNIEQKNYTLEEDGSFGDQELLQHSTFPVLEVDETSLGITTCHSMDDVLPSIFESIESQFWAQEHEVLTDSKELLGCIVYDILKFLSDLCLAKQCPEPELAFPEMFLDMNLICMVESPQVDGNSELFLSNQDADYFSPTNLVILEDIQIFDVDSSQNFEVYLNRQMTHEPEACNPMFWEDMNLKSFSELVVSHELVLVDETFKSLPIPVLSDYGRMRLTCTVGEELLSDLKPQPLSATDGIYLDWYILEEDKFNHKVYSLFQNMVEKINASHIDFEQEKFEGRKLVSDFIFADDALTGSATEQYEEPNVTSDRMPMLDGVPMTVASNNLQDNGCPKPGNSEQLAEKDAKRASLLSKSMSQFNDLDFFLNPRKSTPRKNAGPSTMSFNPKAKLPYVSSGNSVEACASTGILSQFSDLDFSLNPQKGSAGENAGLVAMPFNPNAELPNVSSGHSVEACASTGLLSQFNDLEFFLNSQKGSARENAGPIAMSFNPKTELPNVSSGHSGEVCPSTGLQLQQCDIMVYNIKLSDDIVALIKTFEKCYLDILQNETELISFLREDKFELLSLPKQKLMDCIKKKMARRNTSHDVEDIMAFVALCAIKQMAWYMCFYGIYTAHLYVDRLCRSLGCLKSRLSFLHSLTEDACGNIDKEITTFHPSLCVIRGILQSKTSSGNSKVLILAERVFWWPLKSLLMSMGLSWNELSSFCTSANPSDAYKIDSQLISDCLLASQENVSASFPFNKFNLIVEYGGFCGSSRVSSFQPKSVDLTHLHYLKIELDNSSASKALCEGVDIPQITKKLMEGEFHSTQVLNDNVNYEKLEDLLNFVPIEDKYNKASVKSGDKEEAHGMPQPVAVETNLNTQRMMDIVIIVNMKNFDKDMIVSRRCTYQKILAMEKKGAQVVERDSNLPVDIIISSAICLVWYDCRNIGRKAATLDEASSCLQLCVENIATNILTLLSFAFSGCFLVFEGDIGFLSTVMESSAGLYAAAASLGIDFQLFCSYSSESTDEIILNCIDYAAKMTRGEYPKMPDSETLAESFLTKFPSVNPLTAHAILSSGGMLTEFLEWSHKRRIQAVQNYCVPDESITLFSALCKYGEREDSKSITTDCSSSVASGPNSDKCHYNDGSEGKQRKRFNSPNKSSTSMDESLHIEPSNQCKDDLLHPSGQSGPYNCWTSTGSEMFQDYKNLSSSLNDIFDQKREFDFPQVPDRYDSHIYEGPDVLKETKRPKLHVPLKDNVWGYHLEENTAMLNCLDWQNIDNFDNRHKDAIGEVTDIADSPMSGEGFSFFGSSIPFSSLVSDIEEDSTTKTKISRRLSFSKDAGPSNQEKPMWDLLAQRSAACKGSVLKNDVSNHSATSLSKAILSNHPQQGSPWTIEFLNRIREKSKLRQQNLPSDTSASPFERSGKIGKVSRRRSPSILEFFKYQGGSTPRKIIEQRKQKRHPQTFSSSKNEKTPSSLLQTSTPVDKRARQTLSFEMNGSGSQTKLVWSDGGAHGLSKKLRY